MIKVFKVCVVVFIISNLIGCATIVSGHNRNVKVITNPSEASVTINKSTRLSPATFALGRYKPSYVVRITKEGYNPVEMDLQNKLSGWVFGNLLFGPFAFITFPIDFSTGNAWRFQREIKVDLTPIAEAKK